MLCVLTTILPEILLSLEKEHKKEDVVFATNLLWSQPHDEHFIINHLISSKWLMRTNCSHSTFLKCCKTLLFSIFILNNIISTQKIHILPAFVAHDKTTEKTSPIRMYQSIEHSSL